MTSTKIPISQWPKEDRPRERLLKSGVRGLTNTELLAILIGSGNGPYNAIELAREILNSAHQSLDELATWDHHDLVKFPGIGLARAITIVSAMELGRRRIGGTTPNKVKVTGSQHVYKIMQPLLLDEKLESFWVIYLNRAHHMIARQQISRGGVSGTLVDPKLIFKYAINHLASALILVHNHPSGQLTPSQADIQLTKKMVAAGKLMEIPVLDHLIFANSGYFSFADEELL